jgi:hypothetical protein
VKTNTGVKKRKRKRIGKRTDKRQSARFIEEARKLGLGQSGEDFERAMDSLLKKK